jgi:hypothetical protein
LAHGDPLIWKTSTLPLSLEFNENGEPIGLVTVPQVIKSDSESRIRYLRAKQRRALDFYIHG